MIVKNFINGQITTGTEPIDPISGTSRGLYINSVLSGNSATDTLVGLDINPSYSGTAGNYFGLRVSGDTIFATSGGTQVFRTFNNGSVIIGSGTTQSSYLLDVNGTAKFLNQRADDNFIFTLNRSVSTVGVSPRLRWTGSNVGSIDIYGEQNFFTVSASAGVSASSYQGNFINFAANTGTVSEPLIRGTNGYTGGLFFIGGGGVTGNAGIGFSIGNYTEGMRLVSTGNLLIGTTTDAGQRLQVNGSARFVGGGSTSGTTGFTVVNSSNEVALQVLDNKWIGMQVLSPQAPLHVYYPGTSPNTKLIAIFDGYQTPAQPEMQIQIGTTTNNFASLFGHKTDMGGFVKTVSSSSYAITWNDSSNIGFGGNPVANNTVTIYPRNFSNTSEINTTGAMLRVATGSIQIVPQTSTPDTSMVGLGVITLNSNVIAKTYTNASNLYIDGPPVAGSNTTITNRWSMYVNSGNTYFGGRVMVGLTGDTGFQFTSSGSTLLRGSGTTSSSSALTVQNSSGGTLLNLTNNGNLNVDNGTLYVDGDNGRVGVGTTSPTNPLDVAYSPGRFISFKAATGYADIGQIVFSNTTSAQITSSGTMGLGPSDTNRTLTLGNGFTSKLTIPGSTKYDGFGNQTPSTLAGSTNQPVLFTSTIPDGNIDGFIFENTSSGSRNLFKVIQDNTTLLTLNPNGNLFLGTTTDLGFKLSVSGSTLLRGSGTTSASYALATQNSSGGTTMVVNNAGNMLIGTTTDAGYKLEVNGTARTGDLTIGASGQGRIIAGQFDFYYPNTLRYQSAYYLTIVPHTAGTTQSTGGYVAIKADTIQLLHDSYFSIASGTLVNSGDNVKLKRGANAGHIPMYLSIEGADATAGYNYGTRSGSVLIYPGEQSFDNGYGSVVLAHNGINERGSVLIGTSTTNNSRLLIGGTVSGATLSTTRATHINATLLATGSTTTLIGLDIQPTFTPGSFTGLTQIALRVSGGTLLIGSGTTSSSSALTVQNSSGGTLLNLTNNGNLNVDNGALYVDGDNGRVGVGTTSPTSKLYLDGGLFTKKYYTDTASNTINFGSAYELFGTLHDSSGYSFFINPTGWAGGWNVKIGNTTTSFDFDYSGGFSAFKVNAVALSLGGGQLSYYLSSPNTGWSYASSNGWNFVIRGSDDEKLRITSGGNVLIGTTTDLGFKLSVSGSTLLRGSGTTSASYALATQNSSGGTTMVVNNAGNMLIGTTTDAGYRLDVNGTVRIQGDSIIWGGGFGYLLRQSGGITYGSTHSTVAIQGVDSWGLVNNTGTIGGSNGRISYSSSNTPNVEQTYILKPVAYAHGVGEGRFIIQAANNAGGYNAIGNMYIAGGRNTNGGAHGNVYLGVDDTGGLGNVLIGTNTNNNSRLLIGGTVSGATLNTTRGVHVSPTLLATGSTTTLIGLDIQPTFTPGSFTGLTQLALRVSGGTQIIGSGSTGTTLSLFSVDGASGRLFDVTDDFSNSLFSVNTSSGVPVIEAFANNSIVMGTYGSNTLVVSGTSVSVGTSTSNSTSVLNIVSTTKGVQFPRMTTAQKNSLTGATDILGGLVVFDTNTNKLCCYNGTTWNDLF